MTSTRFRSVAGHGGGWSLAREADRISVGEVCTAMGERLLFAVDRALESGCSIERAVSGALDEFIRDAEAQMLERLGRLSIASLAAQAQHKRAARRKK